MKFRPAGNICNCIITWSAILDCRALFDTIQALSNSGFAGNIFGGG
ncbi:MAG: hypothetical protein LBR26_11055 [Prevotella sp.]|jgi:hypothetical protein|nr:hypothetical protein [Prevotella sp.]